MHNKSHIEKRTLNLLQTGYNFNVCNYKQKKLECEEGTFENHIFECFNLPYTESMEKDNFHCFVNAKYLS